MTRRRHNVIIVGCYYWLLLLSIACLLLSSTGSDFVQFCNAFHTATLANVRSTRHPTILSAVSGDDEVKERTTSSSNPPRRRDFLVSMAATSASLIPLSAGGASTVLQSSSPPTLEDLQIGKGQWSTSQSTAPSSSSASASLSSNDNDDARSRTSSAYASFYTYLARFLIHYDAGAAAWWQRQRHAVSLLSNDQQERKLGQSFGRFAATLQQSLEFNNNNASGYGPFLQQLVDTYRYDDVVRQVGVLCALLPANRQPKGDVRQQLLNHASSTLSSPTNPTSTSDDSISSLVSNDFSALLPQPYHMEMVPNNDYVTIVPPINLYQVGLDEEFGQTATATTFGPLSSQILFRDRPAYSPQIYALFGLSGATGCALTHSIVIPLDVVKTKAQTNTDNNEYSNLWQGATKIVSDEGWSGLFTGAQATLAGYSWYGLSVYPSYTFFKRYLSRTVLPPDWAMAHVNDIALIAGALAAVVASLGLTPLEAARIRVVADPNTYKSLGLIGTLQMIASSSSSSSLSSSSSSSSPSNDHMAWMMGWKRLYAGLPSLLTRQVIFGSVKFLAFERACDAIYTAAPELRDATWTTLMVSLVAGGFSGALSSVVSQPADAVLTYVAQSNDNGNGSDNETYGEKNSGNSLGLLEASQIIVQKDGVGALFRGVGSRCVWAGSIIAGQFLLYDVFRTLLKVTPNDLSQVFQIEI